MAKKAAPKRTARKPRNVVTDVVVASDDGLTDKERLFIEQYFICGLNGTEAAMAVYDCKDRHVAAVMASEYLAKPDIRARVNQRLEQFHLNANEVLARYAFHARGSMEEFIDEDSGAIDLAKAKRAKQLGLIKKYRCRHVTFSDKSGNETETTETEVELHDQQAALRDLGKHLGLFIERNVNLNLDLKSATEEELEEIKAGKIPARLLGRV